MTENQLGERNRRILVVNKVEPKSEPEDSGDDPEAVAELKFSSLKVQRVPLVVPEYAPSTLINDTR